MLGTTLNIPATASRGMTELVSKTGRKEKDNDVLMWVSTAKDKSSGELKAQLRGVGTTSFFQKARNAFLAREPASKDNVRNLFMQRGLTLDQANAALENVTMIGEHYSAKSVKTELEKFEATTGPEKQSPKKLSGTDGKFLAKNVYDHYEVDLKYAMEYPRDDYTGNDMYKNWKLSK